MFQHSFLEYRVYTSDDDIWIACIELSLTIEQWSSQQNHSL